MRAPLLLTALLTALLAAPQALAIGLLVPTDPGVPPLSLVHHRVDVKVTERAAVTHVDMRFRNPTGRQLEATFLFPMPKGASVDELALWMNGKREVGTVMERQKARQIYESIVRRQRDPGLIEYVDQELVEVKVFPIPANGEQRIELTYSHLIDYDGGLYRYTYPMKTDQQATSTLQDFTFSMHVEGRAPIKNLTSPTHALAVRRRGNVGDASLEKAGFSLDDDLRVLWTVDDKDVGVSVLSFQEGDEPGYFMLLASPRDDVRDKEIIGKRVAFVVDTSGSMEGTKIAAVRQALDQCLQKLGEDDLFSIVSFGGYAEAWKDKMVSASRSNVADARKFVGALEPMGGTNIEEALAVAESTATGSDKAPLMVVFLTDGRPTIGDTDVASLTKRANTLTTSKGARLFVLGVGEDLNTLLLDKMSTASGGSALYLKDNAGLTDAVASFYDRVSHPVLANLQLRVDGVTTFGTLPRALGDLFKGQQLVVLGRYRSGGTATVTLRGSTAKGDRTFSTSASFVRGDSRNAFIPRLWAQRQVGMLLDEIRAHGEKPGLVAEVTQLATRFGIVTPYTSYLVLEPGFVPPTDLPRPAPRRPVISVEDDAWMGDAEAAPASEPSTGAGGGAATKSAPARLADKLEERKDRARKSLAVDGGAEGVAAAKEIGKLKGSATTSTRATTTTKQALGRDFVWKDGRYVDSASTAKDARLVIAPYSPAWFAALRLNPGLKAAFALHDEVEVQVAPGKTLVVKVGGKDSVDDAALKAFLGR